jgi:acetyl esterase/lipase
MKSRSLIIVLVFATFCFASTGWSQDEPTTPAEQAQEVVEEVKDAVQELTDSAEAAVQQVQAETTEAVDTVAEEVVVAESVEPFTVNVWPKSVPGNRGIDNPVVPTLTVYKAPADKSTGTAVVVCPGGGYGHLAVDHEGKQVCEWLNSNGITGVMLKYRIAPYKNPIQQRDALQAMRMVRFNAKEWGIDPDKVGILGFSAGGHLASTVGTHFDFGNPSSREEVYKLSSKPDFMILIYPVVTMSDPYTHKGSRKNLLGDDPSQQDIDDLSNEKQVVPYMPPTFLVHTAEDKAVPVENSLNLYTAMRHVGAPVTMHLFEKGRHGFGLAPKDPVLSKWPELCIDWIKQSGF